MRTKFAFAPYRRATVGFDRLFDLLERSGHVDGVDDFPPYDIEHEGEDRYRVTLAVAGFRPEEIEIVAHNTQLTITGRKSDEEDGRRYLHRGIPARAFERHFQLADFVQVREANVDNGLLRIALQREVPDAMKSRRVAINSVAVPANDRLELPAEDRTAA